MSNRTAPSPGRGTDRIGTAWLACRIPGGTPAAPLLGARIATAWLACILLLGLTVATSAAPAMGMLERADLLARWGAYTDADALYQRLASVQGAHASIQATLLARRLGVAEAMVDLPAVRDLTAQLESLPPSALTPEIRLRICLARGGAAIRVLDLEAARRHYEEAAHIARDLANPSGAMGRFVCHTVEQCTRFARRPPSPDEFATAWRAARQELQQVVALPAADPTQTLCTANWVRYWTLAPAGFAFEAGMERKNAAVDAWLGVELEIVASARQVLAGSQDIPNPEAEVLALHVDLDLAEAFSFRPAVALEGLARVETGLAARERTRAQLLGTGAPPAHWLEETRIRARAHRARARLAAFEAATTSNTATAAAKAVEEYGAAAQLFRECRQPMEAMDTLNDLAGVAIQYRVGDWKTRAGAALRFTLEESRRLGYAKGQLWALIYSGQLASQAGALPEAATWLHQAVEILETTVTRLTSDSDAQARLYRQAALAYDLLITVLAKQGRTAEALEMAARCQEQTRLGLLDPRRVATRDPQVRRALETVVRLRAQAGVLQETLRAEKSSPEGKRDEARLRELSSAIARNRQEFFQVLNSIRSVDPEYERVVSIRPAAFAKIQPGLPPDTVVLQYYAAADRLYIFVASRQGLKIHTVEVSRETLDQDVRAVRLALQAPGARTELRPSERDTLFRLHRWLITPVEEDIRAAQVVAVVPSGQLYYLPFAALARPQGSGMEYLVQRKAVVVLTQLELLEMMQDEPRRQGFSVLALGNPDGSLPGAQAEVAELAPLFGQRQVFLREQATKSRLSRIPPGTAVVHLATHGVLDPEDVNASYLVMAGQGAAARLTTGEIYGLDLKGVALVTLSACSTAVGEKRPGAEIATLAQAFSVAGSRSVLASLWNVSDDATRGLMVAFYRELQRGASRAQALRAAQKALIGSDWCHPFYWSGFELVGDWR